MSTPANVAEPFVKTWKPIHTKAVVLHFGGMSNKAIAKECERGEVWTYKILQSPQAQSILDRLLTRQLEDADLGIGDEMLLLAKRSIKNLEKTVLADIKPDAAGKKHQDAVGFELLDRVGHGKNGREGQGEGGFSLSAAGEKRLAEAIEKAANVRDKHQEVLDADYEVLNERSDGDSREA